MKAINQINEVLHRIRVKLHPSSLPVANGAYTARIISEAILGVEEICAALKLRGGFTGNYDDLVNYVRQFLDEMIYKLCDGFAVNTGYFSIHPSVGGFFENPNEEPDRKKHPIRFRFRIRERLRRVAEYIEIEVEQADTAGLIDRFSDLETAAVNKTVTPGGLFTLTGYKIKICGNNPDCGLYFVSTAQPSLRVKASGVLASNTSTKLIGIVPALPDGEYSLEIKTQYTVGGIDLKEPRTVTGGFTLVAG
jgi:hypothetical protein